MASLSVVVNLGIKTPFEFESTSNIEDDLGVVVPIPTCAFK